MNQLILNGAITDLSFEQAMNDSNIEKINLLFDDYADKVLGFIIGFNYSKDEAEKILFKVFLTVWENINAFDDKQVKKLYRILLIAIKHIYTDKKEFTCEKLKILLTRI